MLSSWSSRLLGPEETENICGPWGLGFSRNGTLFLCICRRRVPHGFAQVSPVFLLSGRAAQALEGSRET